MRRRMVMTHPLRRGIIHYLFFLFRTYTYTTFVLMLFALFVLGPYGLQSTFVHANNSQLR
jgi:hypothetical protein